MELPQYENAVDLMETNRSADQRYSDMVDEPAERLRKISGLTVEQLADTFGVSEKTYCEWLSGFPLSSEQQEHLLNVLSLLEAAIQRLGSQNIMLDWLLSPLAPHGKKPIEYLKSHQYAVFGGFLLRARTTDTIFQPISSSYRVPYELPIEEIEEAFERLSPKPWDEDLGIDEETS